MGSEDVKRQSPNVYRMNLLGATVVPVGGGGVRDCVGIIGVGGGDGACVFCVGGGGGGVGMG